MTNTETQTQWTYSWKGAVSGNNIKFSSREDVEEYIERALQTMPSFFKAEDYRIVSREVTIITTEWS